MLSLQFALPDSHLVNLINHLMVFWVISDCVYPLISVTIKDSVFSSSTSSLLAFWEEVS